MIFKEELYIFKLFERKINVQKGIAMYQKVKTYIQKWNMLKKEDRVIVGVSGGADSVCLLLMLKRLAGEWGFSLVAVHVNHGIRADAAKADEQYVERICREWGIELFVFHENVPDYAKLHKLTEEEAGREIRRIRFQEVKEKCGGNRIALAHHENDNVETLLFHLCRGTGLRGLKGIVPVNAEWIRPLLCVKRSEIESYLEEMGISYCTDITNEDNRYTRNRIRNEVIPYLETYINKESVSHMARVAEQMYHLHDYVEQESLKYKEACVQYSEGKTILRKEEYRKTPKALREYLLCNVLAEAAGRQKDLEAVHARLLDELLERQVGKRIDLPYGVKACRTYIGAEIYKEDTADENLDTVCKEVPFRMRILKNTLQEKTFPEKIYTKWFDYDIIQNTVKIRHRQPGDYITINKTGQTQKLKQYFINEKIPQKERERIWLAADGNHILWVVGYRQNQAFQVTDKTKTILEIEFYGGKNNGRDN